MKKNNKLGKFEKNEKVYVRISVFGPCRPGVILGVCNVEAADGTITRCYEVLVKNEDKTETTERIPVDRLCIFPHSLKMDLGSVCNQIKKRLYFLDKTYEVIKDPVEAARKGSRNGVPVDMKKVLSDNRERRNSLEGDIERDLDRAGKYCGLYGVELPKRLQDIEKEYLRMKREFREAIGELPSAKTKNVAGTAEAAGDPAAAQLPVVLPVTVVTGAAADAGASLPLAGLMAPAAIMSAAAAG